MSTKMNARLCSILLVLLSTTTVQHVAAFSSPPRLVNGNTRLMPTPSKITTASTTSSSTRSTKSTIRLYLIPARNRLSRLEWKSPEEWQVEEWLKQYGEVSRFYRRDVFTAGDWVRARRPTRFWDSIRNTFQSGLLRQISLEVKMLALVSLFVVMYNHLVLQFKTQFLVVSWLPLLHVPLVPFQLAAASLGLMLSFRTNVSYQRWNEARTAWGKIINDSRSLARMACTWSTTKSSFYNTNNNDTPENNNNNNSRNSKTTNQQRALLLNRLGSAICSFSRTVMNRTLPKQEDETNFQLHCWKQLTHNHYGQRLVNANHRPTAALAEISSILVDLDFHPLHQVELEQLVTELCSAMGACERIFTSPVPTFYPRHTSRFLAFWLFLLPLALYETFPSLLLVPVMSLMGGFMLGIEELANQMEEPFSILPMEKMCEGSIRGPVMEQVERSLEVFHNAGTIGAGAGAGDSSNNYNIANSGNGGSDTNIVSSSGGGGGDGMSLQRIAKVANGGDMAATARAAINGLDNVHDVDGHANMDESRINGEGTSNDDDDDDDDEFGFDI